MCLNEWLKKKRERLALTNTYKTETVEQWKANGGEIKLCPKPAEPKAQYTKARNARLNGLWNGLNPLG